MSTTNDKQGPYTVERIEMKGRDWWTVVGPNAGGTPAMDNATAKDLCYRLNAAYQAGQADRDELVKALQRVEDELHKRYAHPDYEYEHSTTGRKQPDLKGEQLESEGWEEYKFQRDEWTDSRSYRRKKTITPNP